MQKFYPFRSRRRYASGGINQDSTWWVQCEAIGKAASADSPYLFANEWVAGSLAQFLRLPIPPFAFLQKRTKNTAMFCSYSFKRDSVPSDVKPDRLYAKYAEVCTGIVLFDVLVLNCDRHGGNLKVDNPDNPKDFFMFDHERALFYVWPNEGTKRLSDCAERLGISGSADSADDFHCLIDQIDSIEHVRVWIRKIASIPDWFIDDICSEIKKMGVTPKERKTLSGFLKARRSQIGELLRKHKDRFPRIPKTDWGLLE